MTEVEELREQLNQSVLHSYNLLKKAYMESGREKVMREAQLSVFRGELEVKEKVFMGIVIPQVAFKLKREISCDACFRKAVYRPCWTVFFQSLELILQIAQVEIKVWKLAEELKKTVVRVNALEKYYIPCMKNS
ncbi:MAG: V-type ATP synthase subunit D [Persephonella sp.]|nr:V-type ATP synthase subunit D [Persephonella sp.]